MAFRVINREEVSPVDLDVLERSYDRLERGHLQAVEQSSKLENTLASLDLNEAEEPFRQSKINDIRNALTDNMIYGNAANSLDKVIRESSKIMSDPRMIGRLRAQQEYKKYQDTLDRRTDIPEDYKNYYREKNQYNYTDQVDDKGNIIRGGSWSPFEREVSTVPLDKLLNQGLQWAAKEAGGGDQVRFLDSEGNITTDPTKSITGEYFDSRTNRWERLSKEKLEAGVIAAIESTPGAKESLNQDYKIAKWKYDKNDGYNPDIVDNNGTVLTENQYIQKRIDPFYKAATYYNQTNSIQYGKGLSAQRELINKSTALPRIEDLSIIGTRTSTVKIANNAANTATSEIAKSKQGISEILSRYIDDYILEGKTDDQIKELIYNISDDKIKLDALAYYESYENNNNYLTKLKEGKDQKYSDMFDTYQAITNLTNLPDNDYTKEYNKIKSKFFNGNKSIRQYFANEDTMNNFLAKFNNDISSLESLGIKVGTLNGKNYIELDNENANSLYAFAKASTDAYNETYGVFRKMGSSISNTFNKKGGSGLVFITEDGEEIYPSSVSKGGGDIITSDTRPNKVYNKLLNSVDKLKKGHDIIIEQPDIEIGQSVIASPSVDNIDISLKMAANPYEAGKLSKIDSSKKEQVNLATKGMDLVQLGGYILNKDNKFVEMTTKERLELTTYLRNAKDKDIEVNTVWDAASESGWSPHITIKGEDKPITIIVPGGLQSEITDSWNNNTTFAAKNIINRNSAQGNPVYITDIKKFKRIPSIILEPVNGQSFNIIDKDTKKAIKNISNAKASEYLESSLNWKRAYEFMQNKDKENIPESVKAIANKMALDITNMLGYDDTDIDVIEYFSTNLLNSL